jgi:CheY-like chemotaxis protein
VVEDNEDHQCLLAAVLRDTGVRVEIVGRGEDAIDAVRASLKTEQSYDLVLMDIRLPTLDGYETTQRLRTSGYAGPIVAITARAMEKEIERCHAAGCDACIRKPFDRATVRDTIAEMLVEVVSDP